MERTEPLLNKDQSGQADSKTNLPQATNTTVPQNQPPQYPQYQDPPKSKIVAALLALFLGQLGLQRFYLGWTTSGLVMLALDIIGWLTSFFFIGFIPLIIVWVWAFIDFIRILVGSMPVKDGRMI